MSKKYPVLELWSDDELEWMEVPEEAIELLTDICCRIQGELPLTLCWRGSTGQRFPFSRSKWLHLQRRLKKERDALEVQQALRTASEESNGGGSA